MTDTALPEVIAKPIAILTDGLQITYANGPFAELFETPPESLELLGRAVRAQEALHRAFLHALKRVSMPGHTASFRWAPDSPPAHTFDVHLARLPDHGILAILDEISHVVLSEDIQSGARRYLEEVLNQLDRAVMVVDAGLRVTYMNVAQRELLERMGATTPWVEFVGQPVADAYTILGAEAWRGLCTDAVTCGAVGGRPRVPVQVGASTWWFDIRVVPLGEGTDDAGGAVIITEDVTRLTALEAAVVARDQYAWAAQVVASLHHEINNPLTTILGGAEILQRERDLGTASHACVAAIRAAALHIGDVVQRLASRVGVASSGIPPGAADVDRDTGRAPGPQPDR